MRRIFERSRLGSCGECMVEIAERTQGRHCRHGESSGWRQVEIVSDAYCCLLPSTIHFFTAKGFAASGIGKIMGSCGASAADS